MMKNKKAPSQIFRTARNLLALAIAAALLLATIGCGKKTPQDLLDESNLALQNGDMVAAMMKCNKILEIDPDSDQARAARMLLGSLHARNNNAQKAHQYWKEIIDRNGLQSDFGRNAFTRHIELLNKEGKFKQMVQELEETSRILSAAPIATTTLGAASEPSTATLTATKEFAWQTRIFLGHAYNLNGETPRALKHFATLQATAPDEAHARNAMEQIILILDQSQNFTEIIALLESALAQYPESPAKGETLGKIANYHYRLADTLKDPKAKDAETEKGDESLRAVLAILEKNLEEELLERNKIYLLSQIAQVYRGLRNSEKALKLLEDGYVTYANNPERIVLKDTMAQIYVLNGDLQKAKDCFFELRNEFAADMKLAQAMSTAMRRIDAMIEQKKQMEANEARLAAQATTATLSAAPTTATLSTTTLPLIQN